MSRIYRFWRFPAGRKLILLEAFVRLVAITLVVRLMHSAHVLNRLIGDKLRPVRLGSSVKHRSYQEICWAVTSAARYVPGASCLPQSLVGRSMLQRAGYPAEICLGVAHGRSGFEAHAWVSSEGQVVLGENAIQYAELPTKG